MEKDFLFKNIMIHHINIENNDVIVLGKKLNYNRNLLVEKTKNLSFEQYVEEHITLVKPQMPETFHMYEHIFLPQRQNYTTMEIPFPSDEDWDINKKNCIIFECNSVSEKQKSKNFAKNLREMNTKSLNNKFPYSELVFIASPHPEEGGVCYSRIHDDLKKNKNG